MIKDFIQNRKGQKIAVAVGGDQDQTTPLAHQQILFEKLPGQKELHVINGSAHTFREVEHLKKLKEIFNQWIKKIK